MPSFSWTQTAVAGNGVSPVTVATTIRSSLLRRDRRRVQRRPCRLDDEIRRVDALLDEVAGLDPGPLPDPLVVGVDLVLEPRVGNETGRERGPDAA